MSYALRDGLSFCAVEDRLLFLDRPADRYFCLAHAAERAVARLYHGQDLDPSDRARLAGLARTGLLIDRDGADHIAPCPAPPLAACSLLDSAPSRSRAGELAVALLHLSLARLELQLFGFGRTIARAERRKHRLRVRAGHERVATVAAAFQGAAGLISEHDRCLPRSVALAHRLMRIGAAPDLVIAVKLGPFKAHAWVQCGDALINERVEIARLFTPILVL